jgi:uncharacterized phage protein (TIGR01671 family)
MRTIKFRGQRVDNGEWVYGYLFYTSYSSADKFGLKPCIQVCDFDKMIYTASFEIIPETVGQFTGKKDRCNVDIYEGDVVRINDFVNSNGIQNGWVSNRVQEIKGIKYGIQVSFLEFIPYCEVIGNVHENPELLIR